MTTAVDYRQGRCCRLCRHRPALVSLQDDLVFLGREAYHVLDVLLDLQEVRLDLRVHIPLELPRLRA